ncbi:DUF2235 domain-containing protein [Variovorax sp. J22R24]|uniref:phospholipase effector Tle1 domain-containing protein n=1 Tax=Variovorax gracilis TaxID=3053502 RepID=UPI0025756E6A|nr:DUF2235 domain-containing protein [Variovorax sp. J22R24]MDM0110109.1 DUF2235 domain-containing protein [Variovorax sp. J22R24]
MKHTGAPPPEPRLAASVTLWLLLAGVLFLFALVAIVIADAIRLWNLSVQLLPHFIDVFKFVLSGVIVAILVVALPKAIDESAQRFDRFRESRRSYSKAKTAVLYLPDQVKHCSAAAAFAKVSDAHRELHLAETFEDIISAQYLAWFGRGDLWVPYNYWRIFAVAEALRSCEDLSSGAIDQHRLTGHLDAALNVVESYFKPHGATDDVQPWPTDVAIQDRLSKEAEIAAAIRKVVGREAPVAFEATQVPTSAAGSQERPARNIVICADGTGNSFTRRKSNVARIAELLDAGDSDVQVVAYDQGIGTDARRWEELERLKLERHSLKELVVLPGPHESVMPPIELWTLLRGLAFGAGLRANVKQMYRCLAQSHDRKSDRVFMFGFSRGAFTVRVLAGLLHRCGLPPIGCRNVDAVFSLAWRLYEPMVPDQAAVQRFWAEQRQRRCEVWFLGLWDTVKSYGGLRPVLLPHLRHNPSVRTVRHALALDERRGWFDATTWGWLDIDRRPGGAASRLSADDRAAVERQCIQEVWFTGSHSDVGGGNDGDDTPAGNIALTWMLTEAVLAGIRISSDGKSYLEKFGGLADAKVTPSHTRLWRLIEKVPRQTPVNSGLWPRREWARSGSAVRDPSVLTRDGVVWIHDTAGKQLTGTPNRLVRSAVVDALRASGSTTV